MAEETSSVPGSADETRTRKTVKMSGLDIAGGAPKINVNELNLDLIYSVNPFMDAYEVMSKSLDARVFKSVQTYIRSLRIDVTEDEARVLWPKVTEFAKKFQREPSLDSVDPYEQRLAEVLLYAKRRMLEKNG